MTAPLTIFLENQFGEKSENSIIGGTNPDGTTPIATHTILSNITSGTATPAANTYAAVSAVLLPTQLLTGYTSGAGVVAGTDTTIQAIQKLNGNAAAIKTTADAALPSASFTAAAVTGKVLTGLAAGANTPILSTDTILAALANLQAQITALLP